MSKNYLSTNSSEVDGIKKLSVKAIIGDRTCRCLNSDVTAVNSTDTFSEGLILSQCSITVSHCVQLMKLWEIVNIAKDVVGTANARGTAL